MLIVVECRACTSPPAPTYHPQRNRIVVPIFSTDTRQPRLLRIHIIKLQKKTLENITVSHQPVPTPFTVLYQVKQLSVHSLNAQGILLFLSLGGIEPPRTSWRAVWRWGFVFAPPRGGFFSRYTHDTSSPRRFSSLLPLLPSFSDTLLPPLPTYLPTYTTTISRVSEYHHSLDLYQETTRAKHAIRALIIL